MNYHDRIVRDPDIAGGEPVLKGTRVTLKTVLASLAEGATNAEILADFPTLTEGHIRAAIAFAAASAATRDLPRGRKRPGWKRDFLAAVRGATDDLAGVSKKQLASTIRAHRRKRRNRV